MASHQTTTTRMHDGGERPPPRGCTNTLCNNNAKRRICQCMAVLFCVAIAACLMLMVEYNRADPRYSVAIDSAASVLDPNNKTAAAGVSFNLTLGVASRSHASTACLYPGMFVEVFYRGVKVAATHAAGETRRQLTCAEPQGVAELDNLVARPAGVRVAANVLGDLAAEVRRGAAVFDLRLRDPDGTHWHGGKSWAAWYVFDCKGGRVGGAAVPCDAPTYTEVLI